MIDTIIFMVNFILFSHLTEMLSFCRTLLLMAASALVWWLILSQLCGGLVHGCIHGYFGKLEFLVKFSISKHMQSGFLLLELVAFLMILVRHYSFHTLKVQSSIYAHIFCQLENGNMKKCYHSVLGPYSENSGWIKNLQLME